MKRLLLFLLFFVIKTSASICQTSIGIPKVINFSHEQMLAGTQNWEIDQDNFGTMYIANNRGLITYNGMEWKIFQLPNKTIVRSVYIQDDGKIFVGGQDEFGFFFPDKLGKLHFNSLTHLLSEDYKTFGDVWDIEGIDNKVFLRTSKSIFEYNGKNIIIHTVKDKFSEWSNLSLCDGKIYASNYENKVFLYHNQKFINIINTAVSLGNITSIVNYGKDSLMIATLENGIFISSNNKVIPLSIESKIYSSQIYSAAKINDSVYAIGTVSNGIYFINKKGKTLRHLSRANGLNNNIILSLFLDKNKNIWAGLDDGISLIDNNSPFRYIYVETNNTIATYAINIFNKTLYIGTSDGLYFSQLSVPPSQDISYSVGNFNKMPGTNGQVWSLEVLNNKLLMGHHQAAYVVNKNIVPIANEGSWIFRKLPNEKNIVLGTYRGLFFLKDNSNNFSPVSYYDKDVESLRFIEIDSLNNTIWASHPYRGIYKFSTDSSFQNILSVELLTDKSGLPSTLENYVFGINGKAVFATKEGIYLYDYKNKKFRVDNILEKPFGKMPIYYLKQDEKNRIWFVSDNKVGVLEPNATQVKFLPELTDKLVAGFNYIYPLNDENILFGSNNGVIHFNYTIYNTEKSAPSVLFNKIISSGDGKDSLILDGYFVSNGQIHDRQTEDAILSLPAKNTSIHFEFVANSYTNNNNIQYSYLLKGFDNHWSEWSGKTEKDYTNLPHGNYIFKVKARNQFGKESNQINYQFYIKPFWHQTNFAKLIYTLLALLFVFLLIKAVNKKMKKQKEKFEKEQRQLKYLHELEIEHNEREIINLKNQNLETEIKYKNKELATTTMNLYKKGRLLSKLKEDITEASKKIAEKEQRKDFNKVIKLIDETEKQNNDWEQFSIHFDDVHNNFLKNMKERFPNLSPSDLKICAYLKINLSSKEIAQILNISLKGVEIARYRLRKKLGIDTNVNLVTFLNDI